MSTGFSQKRLEQPGGNAPPEVAPQIEIGRIEISGVKGDSLSLTQTRGDGTVKVIDHKVSGHSGRSSDSDPELLQLAAKQGAARMFTGLADTIAGAVLVPLIQTLDELGVSHSSERAAQIIAGNQSYFLRRAEEILHAGGAVEAQVDFKALANEFCRRIADCIRKTISRVGSSVNTGANA